MDGIILRWRGDLYFECRTTGTVTLNDKSSEFAWIGLADCAVRRHDDGLRIYWGRYS